LRQPRKTERTIGPLVNGGNMRRTLGGNAEEKIYDRHAPGLRPINRARLTKVFACAFLFFITKKQWSLPDPGFGCDRASGKRKPG
jgi:hypothetical protein